ncbi:DUF4127 family protein [Streptomyces odontomachi]|uniref:DUF4127 family protein n=1 Tax=Streptomyces odontomachi TaxID=2944940 RepID=UPI00210A600E|nr:DUF4127 family protein [Streptomyces sp. ODS25]
MRDRLTGERLTGDRLTRDRLTGERLTRRRTVLAAGAAGLAVPVLGRTPQAAAAAPRPSRPDRRIALVPLDDRPVNTYCPTMTAAVAGVGLALPPRKSLGRFFQPGDGAAVARWLGSVGADEYVISVSMLAYGGLIASRTGTPTLESAQANVAAIRTLRAARPDAQIVVHDTIQRLAVTPGNPDNEQYRDALVEWAKLYDQVENLGQEELRPRLDEVRAGIPDAVLDDYLAARARNHEINRQMVEWVADGTISHLVLSEDDTAPVGLARAERVELEQLVAERGVGRQVEVFPGADEVDALLVARLVAAGAAPTYRVEYAGISAEEWTAELEGIPFAENIRRHVKSVGGTVVDGRADLVLLVNTPSAGADRRAADLAAFARRAARLTAAGESVLVVDPVFVNRADHDLVVQLEQQVDQAALLSFSGWNTGGNALGLALAHATARWAFLRRSSSGLGTPALMEPGRAHAQYLLYRFVKDDHWKNVIQQAAYAEARSRGWNPLNLTPEQKAFFDGWVRDRLVPATRRYFADHFAGHHLVLGRRGATTRTAGLTGVTDVLVELPWDRLFEVTLEPHLTLA